MATTGRTSEPRRSRRPPATTPDARERQLTAKAYDLAERQIEDGTASAQVITHFLKLGGTRTDLENEKLRNENELLKARVEQIKSQANYEVLVKEVITVFRQYSGQEVPDDDIH